MAAGAILDRRARPLVCPLLALWIGGDDGWRYAVAITGFIALAYGVIYFFAVTDTPKGSTYFKPKKDRRHGNFQPR